MSSIVKHITGFFLLLVFVLNGVATALPILVQAGNKNEVEQMMETESEKSGEKEERLNEREVARDHQHELDICIARLQVASTANNLAYRADHWPVVYLPVFTPPPEL